MLAAVDKSVEVECFRKGFSVKDAIQMVLLGNRLGFEEVEYQDVEDILNRQPGQLTAEKLQGKQKEEKKRVMMEITKLRGR
ncbi:hypothetical protein M514_02381 [Trichuris suis]|uniref:Uncharacterized protein n=1 Tax=Trichuris suis TaxID=68888 RepID=A0A085MSD6_9BILA|nr:hypothetical protein M513_02381 [Trichuris suis]KFD60132.1 hypothetical protein M514_02381 [Trichuris suis]